MGGQLVKLHLCSEPSPDHNVTFLFLTSLLCDVKVPDSLGLLMDLAFKLQNKHLLQLIAFWFTRYYRSHSLNGKLVAEIDIQDNL